MHAHIGTSHAHIWVALLAQSAAPSCAQRTPPVAKPGHPTGVQLGRAEAARLAEPAAQRRQAWLQQSMECNVQAAYPHKPANSPFASSSANCRSTRGLPPSTARQLGHAGAECHGRQLAPCGCASNDRHRQPASRAEPRSSGAGPMPAQLSRLGCAPRQGGPAPGLPRTLASPACHPPPQRCLSGAASTAQGRAPPCTLPSSAPVSKPPPRPDSARSPSARQCISPQAA